MDGKKMNFLDSRYMKLEFYDELDCKVNGKVACSLFNNTLPEPKF